MKIKIFTLICGLMLSLAAYSQKTVAVYVTSNDDVPQQIKDIFGSELIDAITKNDDYVAIERTDDFLAQVSQEQKNYKSENEKLFALGNKFGASNVCVANISKLGEEYYIVARILDIKSQRVKDTKKKYSTMKNMQEIVSTAEALATDLFSIAKEYSTYAHGDNKSNRSFLSKIENREAFTKVTIQYVAISDEEQIGINRNTYIEDMSTNDKYKLTDVSNINIIDQDIHNYKTVKQGIVEYSLFFERIDENVTNIMIIEPNGCEYKDIVLKPYGDKNLFMFKNDAEAYYNSWKAQQEELYGNKEYSTYALGDNKDNRSFIVKIENRNAYTKVTLKYVTITEQKIGILKTTYIEDMASHEKYNLTDVSNINMRESNWGAGKAIGDGIWEYSLFFQRIPASTRNIQIVEPGGVMYKDIVLKPYGDPNTFVFEDLTENLYDDLKDQQEEAQQAKANKTAWKDVIVSYDQASGKRYEYVTTVEKTPQLGVDPIKAMQKEAYKMGCKLIVITQKPSLFNGNKTKAEYYK